MLPDPLSGGAGRHFGQPSATSLHVRARHLLTGLTRWLTKDPLWPDEPAYIYAGARPSVEHDPSGMRPSPCPPPPRPPGRPSCKPQWNRFIYSFCNCFRQSSADRQQCNVMAAEYYHSCRKPRPRGDWYEFAPPPGQWGDVAPSPRPSPWRPQPPPLSGPTNSGYLCAPTPEARDQMNGRRCFQEGLSYGDGESGRPADPSPGRWIGMFARCHSCCRESKSGPACYARCSAFTYGRFDHVASYG